MARKKVEPGIRLSTSNFNASGESALLEISVIHGSDDLKSGLRVNFEISLFIITANFNFVSRNAFGPGIFLIPD